MTDLIEKVARAIGYRGPIGCSAKPLAAGSEESVWLKTIDKASQDDAGKLVEKLRLHPWDATWADANILMNTAASLIERQAAEIQLAWNTCEEADTAKRHAQAEIERLRKSLNEKETFRGRTY